MATIVLSAVGSAVGAVFGPVGAIAGRAIGAAAGAAIDNALLDATRPDLQGPRLGDVYLQSSAEGRPIQRVYGRARIGGEMIWATRYEEEEETSETGGKGGGPSVSTFRYFANFALALCEGPIARVGRIWADGVEIDQTLVTLRVHPGTEDQAPDPFVLAKQGDAPAYRGTAYVVFERFPLDDYGNRIPQFAFEVIRPVEPLERIIRAVAIIPGATEFGYSPVPVTRGRGEAWAGSETRHGRTAATDFEASVDELTELCPNLERVALVVAWYGDDLRAGACTLTPRVETAAKATSLPWSVAGLDRASARTVSLVDGNPAYGGTPSDPTVVAAIRSLRARGLKVVLYPFVLMDVPAGNALPDPYGGTGQAAHPWRGRVTCHPAAGRPGTPDKTAAAAGQIAAFTGTAARADFSIAGDEVIYAGPAEWSFRRMILHMAHLAAAAGGVDAFLLGSEFPGLTGVRSGASAYPFVGALVALAADVRAVLPDARISYGADWTEWFGHQPKDGSGDVHFHLDPLWASPNVDFIGIDAYWPLADWRYGAHRDAAVADGPHDLAYLGANVAGGEGFDWYYADAADRAQQNRRPIADGAYGKPWVFRNKDLVSWWSNRHFDRPGGVERATATAWVPQSKPFWLTEIGCPAVDLGANQPNLFPDPKSSEAGLPFGSRGARDDLAQRRVVEALIGRFDPDAPGFSNARNPRSSLDGRRMVERAGIHVWAWDARPFPAFPLRRDLWADGPNWMLGHWLNGRLGGVSVEGLIRALLADVGFTAIETSAVRGTLDGYVIADRMAARAALEPVLAAFQVDALDAGTVLRFAGRARRPAAALDADALVEPARGASIETRRAEEGALPNEVAVGFSDVLQDFRRVTVSSRRLVSGSRRQSTAELAAVGSVPVIKPFAEAWLQDVWTARERIAFALPPNRLAIEPGDILSVTIGNRVADVLVDRIEDGAVRAVEGRVVDAALLDPAPSGFAPMLAAPDLTLGPPIVRLLDIANADEAAPWRPFLAVSATPWPGRVAVWRRGGGGFALLATLDRRSTLGRTATALPPGPVGRWDRATTLDVDLAAGRLAAADDADVLAGANRAAVQGQGGRWEILRFAGAELVARDRYRLSRFIRAEGGSEDAWRDACPAGSPFVLLDGAPKPLPIGRDDLGGTIELRVGPASRPYTDAAYVDLAIVPSGRGLLPFSPAQVTAERSGGGDVAVGFVRRSRLAGSDAWGAGEIPFAEAAGFEIAVGPAGAPLRTVTRPTPDWIYAAADQIADFGALPATLDLTVTEVSPTAGPGIPRAVTIAL
jgi:hypothetical protein